jgi:DNA-binding MarR family transcriptional regulator
VERGLVERATSRDDRRVTTLSVTSAGGGVLADAEGAMRAHLDDVLARVDDPAAVSGALTALAAALDERRSARRAAQRAAKARA